MWRCLPAGLSLVTVANRASCFVLYVTGAGGLSWMLFFFPCDVCRDIKPENILCSGAEWPFDVKLTVRWCGGACDGRGWCSTVRFSRSSDGAVCAVLLAWSGAKAA